MKWLKNFFKKLWNVIRKIIAIVLIIIAVIFAVLACFATGGASLIFAMYAIAALAGAFLVDKDTTSKVVGKVGDALGSVAETVGSIGGKVAGGVATGVLGAVLNNPALLIAGGLFLWWALSDGDSKEKKPKEARAERAPDKRPKITNQPAQVANPRAVSAKKPADVKGGNLGEQLGMVGV